MKEKIDKAEVKNILITRTDRLGDVILTLPLITLARKIFVNAKIYFLTTKYPGEILEDYEGIDELLTEEEIPYCLNKYEFLQSKNIDLVISVKPRFDLAFLFYMLGIKYRIGTAYRWYSFLYNYKVHEHRKTSNKHESDYNLNLLLNFFKEETSGKNFYFRYTDESFSGLNIKLKEFNLDLKDRFIILHPGSGKSALDLPVTKQSELVKLLLNNYTGYKIVFTGLESERNLVEEITKDIHSKDRIIDLAGKLNLKELLILIDNCKLFISNSTGPIHIAGALNKNIIGFYPNEKVMSDVRWGPLSRNAVIIRPPTGSDDLTLISTNDIASAAGKLLQ
ncbi:MAG: glycosyltransferase family 9 protein [bacterium]|nr:glycosyltransferase family 9 protein [bacterium]